MRRLTLAAAALCALAATPARAQKGAAARPDEQDMFGGSAPADAGPPAAPPNAAAPSGAKVEPTAPPAAGNEAAHEPGSSDVSDRDRNLLGATGGPEHLSDYIAPDNPLQIGGQLYLRAQTSGQQGDDAWKLTAPSLLDVYLDVRPNPRVRAFVLGRMSFDPTAAPGTATTNQIANGSNGAFAGTTAAGFTTFSNLRGPTTLLDQMWMRFDVMNRVYVTAGKQHVRWGTGRFWQPTDYLHPIKRNPLDVFDARPGQTMLKVHVPWEERGWNFYGFAVTEDPNQATDTLRKVAYGARAEIIVLGAEVGLDGLFKDGQRPRLGLDFSTGLWELDVYGDIGFRWGEDFCAVHRSDDPGVTGSIVGGACPFPNAPSTNPLVVAQANLFDLAPLTGFKVQAVGGVSWSHKYNDNDAFTIGGEYFYNQPGYSDTSLYQGLLLNSNNTPQINFFYTGRQYGALFASFPQPYSWNLTTFTLSTLGNLTDQSFITRLDYSYVLLTHISLEAFAALHYGHAHGEFRFGIDLAGAHVDPQLVDLGVALRLKI